MATRRDFLRILGAFLTGLSNLLSGCTSVGRAASAKPSACSPATLGGDYDYVIVGSGAGGGPLAVNLARAGFNVLVLEAGGNDEPLDYSVPAFHACASEHASMSWRFFVRHYADRLRQKRDKKFSVDKDGVLYPRAGTLGGCTAHNAMIIVYPHNSDWDHIAEVTGDSSWQSDKMRGYFERLERCMYVDPKDTESRHGFNGWLTTTKVSGDVLLGGTSLRSNLHKLLPWIKNGALHCIGEPLVKLRLGTKLGLDPNDWERVQKRAEGLCFTPLSVRDGKRLGTREHLQQAQRECPNNLTIRTHALVTRVLLDSDNRATGVEYLSGAHCYQADPLYSKDSVANRQTVNARREVILCGGAFNTPQLLLLSGIGAAAELQKHGLPVRVELPGVGQNLQDRYEIGVVSQLKMVPSVTRDMRLCPQSLEENPDAHLLNWLRGRGPYTANGAVVGLIKRSDPDSSADPDLFIFGLLGDFHGYYPGYSGRLMQYKDRFTWAILKAHTRNTAGAVRLRSADPCEVPDINFHYFDESNDGEGEDLEAVIKGIESVRRIVSGSECQGLFEKELLPGAQITGAELREFVKDNAWGHHASCTCKMGPRTDAMAVVDSQFRVHGAKNLRVVDASVFPRIPGFFIVSAVYMISEKASDVIIAAARGQDEQLAGL